MPMEQHTDLGEAVLFYLDYGGNGPPVVLLHATGFNPWLWHPIASALALDCRVIVPSFCDHRESDPDSGGLGWTVLGDDLAAFCKQSKLPPPLLVGHSMGGAIAALAQGRSYLNARGIILIEPIFLPQEIYARNVTLQDHPLARRALKRRNHWKSRNEAREYFIERKLFRLWDSEVLDLYLTRGMKESADGTLSLACSPRQEASLFMGGCLYNPWPLLSTIRCPILLVEGEHSEYRKLIDFDRISSLLSNSKRTVIAGAGHLIPMEQPATVTTLIRSFQSIV